MIRKMEERDLEQLAELEQRCFTENWSYAILESGLYSNYDVYYVFEQDERICAYANLRVLAGEGEIERIAVLPEFRGMGIGRKLMEAMLRYTSSRKLGAVYLEVRESNIPAINLYRAYGFLEYAKRKEYYHFPTEDAVMMKIVCI